MWWPEASASMLMHLCDPTSVRTKRFPSPFTPTGLPRRQGFPVANIKSQIKRNKQNENARLRNKAVRSNLKTRIKTVEAAATAGAEETEATLRQAISTIDRAAGRGVIHKNAAARKKSRLVKRIAALSAEA